MIRFSTPRAVRRLRRATALTLAAVATGLVAVPAHATGVAADGEWEQAIYIGDNIECTTEPNMDRYTDAAKVRPVLGQVYEVGPVLRGYRAKPRKIRVDGGSCYVSDGQVAVLYGSMDPADWTGVAVAGDQSTLHAIDGLVNRMDMSIRSAPSTYGMVLDELDVGEVLTVAEWTTTGGSTTLGRGEWTAISYGGVPAWIPDSSIVRVPTYTADDLSSTWTPPVDVQVYAAPSDLSQPIGTLPAGESVPSNLTPLYGYVPVLFGEETGWVSHAEMFPAEATPSAEPTEPTLIDKAADRIAAETEALDKQLAESDTAKSADDDDASLTEWAKEKFTNNPVAKAAAQVQLVSAGLLAALALVLAGLGHRKTRQVSHRREGGDRSRAEQAVECLAPGTKIVLAIVGYAAPTVAVGVMWLAAKSAPNAFYVTEVLAACAVGGLLVGGALGAQLVIVLRGGNRGDFSAAVRRNALVLLAVTAGAGGALALLLDQSPAAALAVAPTVAAIVATTFFFRSKPVTDNPETPASTDALTEGAAL